MWFYRPVAETLASFAPRQRLSTPLPLSEMSDLASAEKKSSRIVSSPPCKAWISEVGEGSCVSVISSRMEAVP